MAFWIQSDSQLAGNAAAALLLSFGSSLFFLVPSLTGRMQQLTQVPCVTSSAPLPHSLSPLDSAITRSCSSCSSRQCPSRLTIIIISWPFFHRSIESNLPSWRNLHTRGPRLLQVGIHTENKGPAYRRGDFQGSDRGNRGFWRWARAEEGPAAQVAQRERKSGYASLVHWRRGWCAGDPRGKDGSFDSDRITVWEF